mmetsp:Transcript_10041/g.16901  ORF Transcript_10041/g.16901 Transcript_10041/m.16901 type:complete len:212 (+) Transcript_10041:672-1307(+)
MALSVALLDDLDRFDAALISQVGDPHEERAGDSELGEAGAHDANEHGEVGVEEAGDAQREGRFDVHAADTLSEDQLALQLLVLVEVEGALLPLDIHDEVEVGLGEGLEVGSLDSALVGEVLVDGSAPDVHELVELSLENGDLISELNVDHFILLQEVLLEGVDDPDLLAEVEEVVVVFDDDLLLDGLNRNEHCLLFEHLLTQVVGLVLVQR